MKSYLNAVDAFAAFASMAHAMPRRFACAAFRHCAMKPVRGLKACSRRIRPTWNVPRAGAAWRSLEQYGAFERDDGIGCYVEIHWRCAGGRPCTGPVAAGCVSAGRWAAALGSRGSQWAGPRDSASFAGESGCQRAGGPGCGHKALYAGPGLFRDGCGRINRYDLAEVSRTQLQTLSKQSGDTTMLCLRSGLNLVCVDVEMGSFPIKALPMDIGSRRPLGAGASGVAMLAALPDFEIEPTLRKLAPRLADAPGQELERVQETVSACRALGYALVPDEPMGRIMGLAVTFANRRGRPQGTLSINGIPERFGPERLPSLLEALHSHARTVEQAMSRLPDSERHRARWAAAGGKRTERS